MQRFNHYLKVWHLIESDLIFLFIFFFPPPLPNHPELYLAQTAWVGPFFFKKKKKFG